MRWLRAVLICCLFLPCVVFAQESSDRGFIQGLLEDALSAPGRVVRIEGFAGALSSRATIERITVTDQQGEWLSVEGVAMVWNRAGLLRGEIDIEELSAAHISLARQPLPDQSLPSPEASGGFALPELPVSVRVARMGIDRVDLGAPILGEPVRLQLEASAELSSGAGDVRLTAARLDKEGEVRLAGTYDNATTLLALDLSASEPAAGIAATLIGLPGVPPTRLSVNGAGPLDAFDAALSLQTDGVERVSGDFRLRGSDADGQRITLDLGGDIAPLVAPELRDFLGSEVRLSGDLQRAGDGRLRLDALQVSAAALAFEATGEIAPDGWPERLSIAGRITPPNGTRVILPLGGGSTSVSGADLQGAFDARRGDVWRLSGTLEGLQGEGVALDSVDLDGQGAISKSDNAVTGRLEVAGQGIDLADPALTAAVGERLSGVLSFEARRDAPLQLRDLRLGGEDYALTGAIDIETGEELVVRPNLALQAGRIARFAPLSGLDLEGTATLALTGALRPLAGTLDLLLNGGTQGLATGVEPLDPLISGAGRIRAQLVRDERGVRLDGLRLETDAARISGQADLRTGASRAAIDAEISDISVSVPTLSGPVRLNLQARQSRSGWSVKARSALPGGARADYDGIVEGDGQLRLLARGRLNGNLPDLADFSALAGRELAGQLGFDVNVTADLLTQSVDLRGQGRARGLSAGIAAIEPLLEGEIGIGVTARRGSDGVIRIPNLSLDAPRFSAALNGTLRPEAGQVDLSAALGDLAVIVPGLKGAGRLSAKARQMGPKWRVDLDASLPGASTAKGVATFDTATADTLGVEAEARVSVGRLGAFSGLAGRSLAGSGALDLSASGDLLAQSGRVSAKGRISDPGFGVPALAPLLRGQTDVDLEASRDAQGRIRIERATLRGQALTAEISGAVGPEDRQVSFDASLSNLALLVPNLPGPARLSGQATDEGARWRINANGSGPGGITLEAAGGIVPDGPRLDLSLSGRAPLALANRSLSGQALSGFARFDLGISGPPRLDALSGLVALEGARLALPDQGITVEGIEGALRIGEGRARLDLSGGLSSGGRLQVSGPIELAAPFRADLQAGLLGATIRQGDLFETLMDARLTVSGPLTGGARIGGTVDLGETELRIAETAASYSALEGLRHLNPSRGVRRSLSFAGRTGQPQARTAGPDFPIDLTIRAPNRIFVRGRGLDAELGGVLRLTGSTNAVVPVGGFDLIRGRLNLLTRRLVLTDGSARLQGSFDPDINFAATTNVEGTDITLRIAGPASAPDLSVTSSPELPQDEALSLFLFGRNINQISALQAVRLAAAVRTLAGSGGGGLGEELRQSLGVDDLDISTDADGNAQARVGRYISDNAYTDISINSEGESQINLNIDLTPNLTLRGRVGSNGDSGIGIFFERDY